MSKAATASQAPTLSMALATSQALREAVVVSRLRSLQLSREVSCSGHLDAVDAHSEDEEEETDALANELRRVVLSEFQTPAAPLEATVAPAALDLAELDRLALRFQPPGFVVPLTTAEVQKAAVSSASDTFRAAQLPESAGDLLGRLGALLEGGETLRDADAASRDSSLRQLMLDVERDSFDVDGATLIGSDVGSDAVVSACASRLAACAEEVCSLSDAVSLDLARELLRMACRTESGSVAYAITKRMVVGMEDRHSEVHLSPDSSQQLPTRLRLSVGAYQRGEEWDVGLRASLEAVLVFRVVRVSDSEGVGGSGRGERFASLGSGPGARGRWDFADASDSASAPGTVGRIVTVVTRCVGYPLPGGGVVVPALPAGQWEDVGPQVRVRLLFVDSDVDIAGSALWTHIHEDS
jgi:hypothetical protein